MKKLVLETTAPFQGLPELVADREGLFAILVVKMDVGNLLALQFIFAAFTLGNITNG